MSVPVYTTNYPSNVPYDYQPVLNTYVSFPSYSSGYNDYNESYNNLQPIYTTKPESLHMSSNMISNELNESNQSSEHTHNVVDKENKKIVIVSFIILTLMIIGGVIMLIKK